MTSSRPSEAAAPVEIASPPSAGATHQSRGSVPEIRAPRKSRNRPSGDQSGPKLLGQGSVPKSAWKGTGVPPPAGTMNMR
jgi:hypothetical protein